VGISPGKVSASGGERKTACDGKALAPILDDGGGSSKGHNQHGLHQTGITQRRQARRVVVVAQNTVEWRRFVRKRCLGFSSVFAKISHDSSPIYRGFACRSRTTRIQL
jgi:hypothetical protein